MMMERRRQFLGAPSSPQLEMRFKNTLIWTFQAHLKEKKTKQDVEIPYSHWGCPRNIISVSFEYVC